MAAHTNSTERDRKHHHYLKGSLFCGRCGARMGLAWAKGNGGRYPYFLFPRAELGEPAANSPTCQST